MLKIFITRHWRTLENIAWIFQWHMPWTLAPLWIEQANMLGKRFQDEKLDIIYCSPLSRTVDTLNEILKFNSCSKIEYTKSLIERDAWEATWKKWDEVDFTIAKWVETNQHLKIRAWEFIESVIKKHKNESILLVTHGWFIKRLFAYIHNLSENEMVWKYTSKNCSVSLIEAEEWKIKEIYFNDISHLD